MINEPILDVYKYHKTQFKIKISNLNIINRFITITVYIIALLFYICIINITMYLKYYAYSINKFVKIKEKKHL